jgi:hypothetical protein
MCAADRHDNVHHKGTGGVRDYNSAQGVAARAGRLFLVDPLQWPRSPSMGGLADTEGTQDMVRGIGPLDISSTV